MKLKVAAQSCFFSSSNLVLCVMEMLNHSVRRLLILILILVPKEYTTVLGLVLYGGGPQWDYPTDCEIKLCVPCPALNRLWSLMADISHACPVPSQRGSSS